VVVLIQATPPFDQLSPELLGGLLDDMLVEYFEPDERILAHGEAQLEHIYFVESGSVRLLDVERRRLTDLCGEGDMFGADALLSGEPLRYEAIAAEPTVCALIPAGRFETLRQACPGFADFFTESLKPRARAVEATYDAADTRLIVGSRTASLVRKKPLTCPPGTLVRQAAGQMRSHRVGSILIVSDGRVVGIVTDTDLRNKIVAEGASADTPIDGIMSAPVYSIGAQTPVFDALMEMSRRRIHHLVVTRDSDPDSPLIGTLSDEDIAHAKGMNPAATIKRLEKARSIEELARIRTEADGHLLRLYQHGIQCEDLTEVITEINDHLTVRLLKLAEEHQRAEHPDQAVDLRWTWLTLGSKGRREMGLTGDQDNALLYEDPSGPEEQAQADKWFGAIARRVVMGLAACGFTLCKGGVMATNPKWRQPLAKWKRIFRKWILEPEPKALMHSSIFFDLRPLSGHAELAGELTDDLCDALRSERGVLTFMTHNALIFRPPLSFFRRFVVDRSGEYRNSFDLKLHGLTPVVDMARVLALDAHYFDSSNTFDRLEHVGGHLDGASTIAASASDALRYLHDMRLAHHLNQIEAGEKPDNHINPETLSKTQQQMLRAVFSTVQDAQESLSHRYGEHMMRR
jgi:CBS domain-containing protein